MIELVVSLGVVMLVLGGVAGLMIKTMGNRTRGFDRKKATRLGSLLMEELVAQKENDPASFWQLTGVEAETREGFEGYVYGVDFDNVVNPSNGCGFDDLGVGTTNCVSVVLNIAWSGSIDQSLDFNRFFSR